MTAEQTEQVVRNPSGGTFDSSSRKRVPHPGQLTLICMCPYSRRDDPYGSTTYEPRIRLAAVAVASYGRSDHSRQAAGRHKLQNVWHRIEVRE